ncbi:MAG: type II toxin-antitoxin system VapC family toxin [Lentisphaeria bacterium]|nr:type II toxin-antitoxin system VapC family toxin [Lentisphaeria bacterium]
MRGYLLDTNVISELRKGPRAAPSVRAWFDDTSSDELFLSVLVTGEIRRGIERIRRRDLVSAQHLDAWLAGLRHHYDDRILPVTEDIAELWGQSGLVRPLAPIDGLLAATAQYHHLVVVTRNVSDFADAPADVLNPFDDKGE